MTTTVSARRLRARAERRTRDGGGEGANARRWRAIGAEKVGGARTSLIMASSEALPPLAARAPATNAEPVPRAMASPAGADETVGRVEREVARANARDATERMAAGDMRRAIAIARRRPRRASKCTDEPRSRHSRASGGIHHAERTRGTSSLARDAWRRSDSQRASPK